MSRQHAEVRLQRGDFSGGWFAVRLAKDGRTVLDKWPIHPDDADALDTAFLAAVAPTACGLPFAHPAHPRPRSNPQPNPCDGELR